MNNIDHFKLGNICQGVESLLHRLLSADKLTASTIKSQLIEILRSAKGKRIAPDLLEKIRSVFEAQEWRSYEGSFFIFEPYKPEAGKMFSIYYIEQGGGQAGSIGRFEVKHSDAKRTENEQTTENAKNFARSFRTALGISAEAITKRLKENAYFTKEALSEYFLHHDALYAPEDMIRYGGDSADLAIALATFSAITNIPVPVEYAASGKLSLGGDIGAVEGLDSKLKMIAAELPEVRTVILPEDSRNKVPHDAGVSFVRNFDEALDIIFPDLDACLQTAKIRGKVELLFGSTVIDAMEINELRVVHGKTYPQVIKQIRISPEKLRHPGRGIVISAPSPLWIVAPLVIDLKNNVPFIALFDPKVEGGKAVIVSSTDESFPRGGLLNYNPSHNSADNHF